MKKIIDSAEFKDKGNLISVKLHANPFGLGGRYYGSITRNTADVDNIIARIMRRNTGLSEFVVKHVTYLLKQEVLEAVRHGQAVNILGLVTLYLAPSGSIKADSPDAASIPSLEPRFAASPLVSEVAASLQVDRVEMEDNSPRIETLTDLYTGLEGATLTAGTSVRVTGGALKITGEQGGIFLVPLGEEEGQPPVADESQWIPVTRIIRNLPKTLEFYLPAALPTAVPYRLALRTGGKEPLTSYSEVLAVTPVPPVN